MIILWASILTIVWGVLFTMSSEAGGATATEPLGVLGHTLVGLMLISLGVISLWGVKVKNVLFSVPSIVVLLIAGSASLSAVIRSAYGDGVIRAREFIAADQAPLIVGLVLLTIIAVRNIRE